MRYSIAERHKKSQVTLKDNVLYYRHPWVMTVDKEGNLRGYIIRRGVGKLSSDQRDELRRQTRILLERAPRISEELPAGVMPDVADPYFKAFSLTGPKENTVHGKVNAFTWQAIQDNGKLGKPEQVITIDDTHLSVTTVAFGCRTERSFIPTSPITDWRTEMFAVGQIVKFAQPECGEEDLRFEVAETDELRPLVRLI